MFLSISYKIIAANVFNSIIMLRFGKTKVSKEEFYGTKTQQKFGMLKLKIN